MKIAVLGAAGRTGRLLVERALREGHQVRALVRDPSKLPARERLEVRAGDARDPAAIDALVEGVDAVVSALGPTMRAGDAADVCSTATTNVLGAMRKHGVKRYVITSGAGLDVPGDKKDVPGKIISKIIRWVSPAIVADKDRERDLLLSTDHLEWVLVRPPRLVDAPGTGQIAASIERSLGSKIPREDLAAFLLEQARAQDFVRKAPFVSG